MMETVKEEINGSPMPQRQQSKMANMPNQSHDNDHEMKNEKPRFQHNMGGNNNRGNRGNRFGNRNNQGNQNHDSDRIPSLLGEGGNRGGGGGGGGNRGNRDRVRSGGGGGGNNGGDNSGDRDGGRNRKGQGGGDRDDYMLNMKLKNLSGPTHELQPFDINETKFSGRNRLYIGNLTNDVTEEELRELFKPYGEISEAFINAEKNFAFLKVDYHANAERAKRELDGTTRKNRQLRMRFAPNATIIRVKNLTPFVTNELLYRSFELFGPIERAVIVVDDRGKSTGEGIVEFARKQGASMAIRYCTDKCFFLTASLRPCVVEPFELSDDTDGLSDKAINKKTQEFFKERQVGPRFAEPGSFEHEYGTRWKQLHELFRQKHEALKRELLREEEKLEAQMEFARYEHETELLREELRQREMDRERQKMEWEIRERHCEEIRNRDEEQMRRQQEDMQLRITRQDDEMRRRQQENTLFMQAQQLNSLLDQQEGIEKGTTPKNEPQFNNSNNNRSGGNQNNRTFINFGSSNSGGNNMAGNQDQGFLASFGTNNQQNQGGGGNNGGPQQQQRTGNLNRWNDRRGGGGPGNGGNAGNDDFQNKRRRF